MVEFRISGESFEPDRITKLLSLSPDEFWLKGDKIRNRNIHRQCCCWSLSTGYKESLDVNKEIKQLLSQLEDKKEVLLKIAQAIAAFNALKRLANTHKMEDVIRWNEENALWYGGAAGVRYDHIGEFFIDLGYNVTEYDMTLDVEDWYPAYQYPWDDFYQSYIEEADVSIFTFYNTRGNPFDGIHTVAITKEVGKNLRVYNKYNNSTDVTEHTSFGNYIDYPYTTSNGRLDPIHLITISLW